MIQLLKLAGYRNIVATASQRNHEYLKALGATHTFDYRSPSLASELLGVTSGQKYKLAVDNIAAKSSLGALSRVLGAGSTIGLLLPVKEGDTVTNHPDTRMALEIFPWVVDLLPEVDIRPVATFTYQQVSSVQVCCLVARLKGHLPVCLFAIQDAYMRDNVMPHILPQLLEKGLLEANRIRLLKSGTLQERVEQGLDLLRNNKISGEKVVVEIKAE